MDYFTTALEAFIDFLIANPSTTKNEANNFLLNYGLMSYADTGIALDDWAIFYNDLGLVSAPNWSQLRNYLETTNADTSKILLSYLITKLRRIPSVRILDESINIRGSKERRVAVNIELDLLRAWKAALPG